ncbi:MAG: L-type lectin-domain containing protein [Chitinispirillia bacterium]|jgi:hypothetical protein
MKFIIADKIEGTVKLITALLLLLVLITVVYGRNYPLKSQIEEISYDDFNDISELQLNGDAAQAEGINGNKCLRVTPSRFTQAGSFFSKNSIPLVDSTGFNASFHSFFSFRITDSKTNVGDDPDGPGADGIVFVIQTVANNVGGNGGGIGYKGIPRSVGIEFDTWKNGENGDINGNHIGINTNGNAESLQGVEIEERMNSGKILYAWIDYNGITDILEVRFSDKQQYPLSPVLTYTIDLTSVFKEENVFVGFTSGTGAACNNHDILSFKFYNNSRISSLIESQRFLIRESVSEGFTAGTVLLNNSFEGKITLTPFGLPGEFSFNAETRVITIAENAQLNYEKNRVYTFNIEALYVDTIAGSLVDIARDTALITIHILKGNLIDHQTFSIKETEKGGFEVGKVKVNSPEPDNIKLTPFSIPSEFQFDNRNKTISVAPDAEFDYSEQREYTFDMQAIFIDTLTQLLIDTLFDTAVITIQILRDIINVTEAVYRDENGDGSIDCAIISLDRKPDDTPLKIYLINPFDSSDSTLIKKDYISRDDKILKIKLAKPFPFSGSTFFQTDKYGFIEDSRYSESGFEIKDGIAPVILQADYYPEKNGVYVSSFQSMDTLTVKFSEITNEDIEYSRPFKFMNKSNNTYTMTLKQMSKSDNIHTFIVEEISNNIRPSFNSNDSIWIDIEAKIADTSMNHQNVSNNRKVKLKLHRGQFKFVVKPLTPFTIGKTDISKINNLKPQFLTGTVITVDFLEDIEELISEYFIQIFDPVGNTLVNSKKNDINIDKILVNEKNRTKIYFFWNGYNTNNRPVASGSYYGLVNAEVDNSMLSKEFYLLVTSD